MRNIEGVDASSPLRSKRVTRIARNESWWPCGWIIESCGTTSERLWPSRADVDRTTPSAAERGNARHGVTVVLRPPTREVYAIRRSLLYLAKSVRLTPRFSQSQIFDNVNHVVTDALGVPLIKFIASTIVPKSRRCARDREQGNNALLRNRVGRLKQQMWPLHALRSVYLVESRFSQFPKLASRPPSVMFTCYRDGTRQ